ncbi:MAG: hypothetical protein HY696_04375 [Deltaproteobacteria bacterium]|nr:hypothetical protein [Deltaproteobacteria bacterium]
MRIGIDFDNTIVNYDAAFFRAARAHEWIGADVPATRVAVRAALRAGPGGSDRWTALQGEVYGARLLEDGVVQEGWEAFWAWAALLGIPCAIISHKTLVPAVGPAYPLRDVARTWLERQPWWRARSDAVPLIFAETLTEKIAQIAAQRCTVFIDDHLDVLTHPQFPAGVRRIWYGVDAASRDGIVACCDWAAVQAALAGVVR